MTVFAYYFCVFTLYFFGVKIDQCKVMIKK